MLCSLSPTWGRHADILYMILHADRLALCSFLTRVMIKDNSALTVYNHYIYCIPSAVTRFTKQDQVVCHVVRPDKMKRKKRKGRMSLFSDPNPTSNSNANPWSQSHFNNQHTAPSNAPISIMPHQPVA